MLNHYTESWELYKLHSELFREDYDYYYDFCYGYKTLEIFAGYGRLANYLIKNKVDIETVELEKNFAKYINLPSEKNYICDILEFAPNKSYERIIAGYNSFCLFLEDEKIHKFFERLDNLANHGAQVSLSYFPINAWRESPEQILHFKNTEVRYRSIFDFSKSNQNIAVWIDEYVIQDKVYKYDYPVRVYSTPDEVMRFAKNTNLELINIIDDYNKNIEDTGWKEFVFQKK